MLNYSDEYDFLDVFASWKSLTFLSLSGSSFSLEEIKKIAKVKGLQRLGLPDATLPKGSLEVLSYLPSLKTLNLSWCKGVSTEEWEHLRSFSKLRSLDLSDSRFNTNIVDILLSIKSLRHLNLKGCSPASLELEPLRAQLEAFGGELLFDQRRPFFMDTKYIGTFFVGGLFGVVAGSVATLLGQDSLMTLFPMLSLFWIWIFMMCAFTFGAVKVLTEE
ncbi:MAG: hypothetical protein EP343_11435 [Deltaproteobacteria bacterium]|nr:MAG: hypothetical protein EP343_11435 [Deltaproteobacteria bacterium]